MALPSRSAPGTMRSPRRVRGLSRERSAYRCRAGSIFSKILRTPRPSRPDGRRSRADSPQRRPARLISTSLRAPAIPTPAGAGISRGRLRGGEEAVLVEGQKAKSHDSSWKPPLRERWTIEVDRTEVKLLVDGKEVQRHAHGLTITEEYRVELQGSAKLEAPKGSRVRFDNVKIEP